MADEHPTTVEYVRITPPPSREGDTLYWASVDEAVQLAVVTGRIIYLEPGIYPVRVLHKMRGLRVTGTIECQERAP